MSHLLVKSSDLAGYGGTVSIGSVSLSYIASTASPSDAVMALYYILPKMLQAPNHHLVLYKSHNSSESLSPEI